MVWFMVCVGGFYLNHIIPLRPFKLSFIMFYLITVDYPVFFPSLSTLTWNTFLTLFFLVFGVSLRTMNSHSVLSNIKSVSPSWMLPLWVAGSLGPRCGPGMSPTLTPASPPSLQRQTVTLSRWKLPGEMPHISRHPLKYFTESLEPCHMQ